MTTIGERVMERLDTLEETVRGFQGLTIEDVRRELAAELISVRTQIGNMTASGPAGAQNREGRSLYNSKEFLPDKLVQCSRGEFEILLQFIPSWMERISS